LFTLSSYLTSLALVEERRSGIWNRALTAGVKPCHFLLSHIVTGFLIMLLQTLEYIVYAIYVGPNSGQPAHLVLLSLLLLSTGLSGILYGLCVSAFTDSVIVAACFSLVLGFPFLSLSGKFKETNTLHILLKISFS
jgi:ABC-type multidrug transport system permease subunit